MFKKQSVRLWTEFHWLRIWHSVGALVNMGINHQGPTKGGESLGQFSHGDFYFVIENLIFYFISTDVDYEMVLGSFPHQVLNNIF
jgi:hypothetical protein